jgi:poly(3-hydroxybutyrate) depolymerase
MFYQLYELNHAAMAPYRAMADVMRLAYANPFNPLSQTPWGRTMAASLEMFERTTRRYGKPSFDLPHTVIGETKVAIREEVVWARPF